MSEIYHVQLEFVSNQVTEIEIEQQDIYCRVTETIQFRPATFDELRRQLDLKSDSLGAEMKSNDAGYVHSKDNNRKVSSVHVIELLKPHRKVMSFFILLGRFPFTAYLAIVFLTKLQGPISPSKSHAPNVKRYFFI